MISASKNHRLITGQFIRRSSLFFTPRTQINTEFSDAKTSFAEDALASENVPTKPEFAPELKIFKEIVRPNDLCNLFLVPRFNDVIVAALAKDSPISGKPNYSITSKSSITDTKLLFAETVIRWMDETSKSIPELLTIPDSSLEMRYSETDRDDLLNKLFTNEVWSANSVQVERPNGSIDQLTQIELFFEKAGQQGVSLEKAAAYLLSQAQDNRDFKMLIDHIQSNDSLLMFLSYFASKAVENVFNNYSAERGQIFRQYFMNRLKYYSSDLEDTAEHLNDAAVLELEPLVLDKLVYTISSVATSADHLAICKAALLSLTRKYGFAPLPLLFQLFLSSYCKLSTVSRDQVLEELAPYKACFIHVPISEDFFTYFLKTVIDSTYDLSHFLRVVAKNSPTTLKNSAKDIVARLRKIQADEEVSELLARVQLAQVGKLLLEAGLNKQTCEGLTCSSQYR